MSNDIGQEWTPRGTCAVCSEPIEGNGAYLRHSHADRDTYCGCGDGSTATRRLEV